MKNTDLRVGNYLQRVDGSIVSVKRLIKDDDDILVNETQGLFTLGYTALPISLTEEILLKCGFEKGCFYHTKPVDFRIKINENYYVLIYFFGSDVSCYVTNMEEYDFASEIYVDIKYLHELQNLISSTKGKELKIEL